VIGDGDGDGDGDEDDPVPSPRPRGEGQGEGSQRASSHEFDVAAPSASVLLPDGAAGVKGRVLPSAAVPDRWRPFGVERPLGAGALVARFAGEREVLSWAIWRGGRRQAQAVAWVEVKNTDLPLGVDPRQLLGQRLEAAGLAEAVGFLTSRRLDRFEEAEVSHDGVSARALATVGLSNAVRVGDEPGPLGVAVPVGTINVLCEVSAPLTEEAALEALSLGIEARTAAVVEVGFPSRRGGQVATGTGTDCAALAWPAGAAPALEYAGKHTAVGHVVGLSVYRAVRAGVRAWLQEQERQRQGDQR
jgi:adenosylcobinamide amidohydrolase